MLSVLIVEDESKVSLLIKNLINWDELNLNLLGIADNGKDAFDLIVSRTPDIVITDIRMPKMDGLELIRQTRFQGLNTKFIIISGYRHFDYAHQAIKFGIEDYLLKPINQNELNSILNKISVDINGELKEQQAEKIASLELAKSHSILLREFVEMLITGSLEVLNLASVNNSYSVNFQQGLFQALTIKLDNRDPEESDITQDNLVTEKVLDITENALKPLAHESVFVVRGSGLITCIVNLEELNKSLVNKAYGSLLNSIQDYIYAFKEYEVTIGIGNIENDFEKLHQTLSSSIKAVQYRIKVGVGEKIYFDDFNFTSSELPEQIITRAQEYFPKHINSFDSDKLKLEIEDVFSILSKEYEQIDPGVNYDLANMLIRLFFNYVQQIDQKKTRKIEEDLTNKVMKLYSVQRMIRFLQDNLGMLLDSWKEQKIAQTKKPIRDAKKYLAEHYMEKVLLEDISKIVNLNPVYFSVVFKKETGKNFSEYVVDLRMDAAKALLRETNMPIKAIGFKVGYEDIKYFSQLFKKIVGVNPVIYRKLYS